MKWTSATALLVALSAAGAGATYVLTRRPMGPTEIIAQIRSEMGEVTFEQRTALRQLELALKTASIMSDEKSGSRVKRRGSLLVLSPTKHGHHAAEKRRQASQGRQHPRRPLIAA